MWDKKSVSYQSENLLKFLNILLLFLSFGLSNPVRAQSQQDTKLLPFFDNVDNPVPVGFPPAKKLDISPPAPELNSFDLAVLRICGPIGTTVKPDRFKQLLSDYPDVLEKLQQVTSGELRPGRRSKSEFIEDLIGIWFKRKGFEHIFCGEIYDQNDIGGLHFYGRYLQFQQQGIGGRLPNNTERQEVVPGIIYTMGVIIKQDDRTVTDVIKGYGYLSNALEMLLDITQIYKLQGNTEGACIYQVRDRFAEPLLGVYRDTGKTFPAVFVRRGQAIITFYPDATPKGRECKTASKT